MQARVIIFGLQVDNDVMYCIVGLQTSLLLLILPCLSSHTLYNDFFVSDFFETVQARVIIFGLQVDNDVMYCIVGLQTNLLLLILPCIFSGFLSFHTLNNEIFCLIFL